MSKKEKKTEPTVVGGKVNEVQVDTSAFGIMQDVKARQERGEKIDDYTKEAIETVEFASNLMDSILSGRQIDLEFYRLYTRNAIANLRRLDKRHGIRRTIKSRIEDEKA